MAGQLAANQLTIQQSVTEAIPSHHFQVIPALSSLFVPFLLHQLDCNGKDLGVTWLPKGFRKKH